MLVTTVESTVLSSAVYDASRQLLWLEFQGGSVYCYFGVPSEVHQQLISALSNGKYFNLYIRGRFAYRKETLTQRPIAETSPNTLPSPDPRVKFD